MPAHSQNGGRIGSEHGRKRRDSGRFAETRSPGRAPSALSPLGAIQLVLSILLWLIVLAGRYIPAALVLSLTVGGTSAHIFLMLYGKRFALFPLACVTAGGVGSRRLCALAVDLRTRPTDGRRAGPGRDPAAGARVCLPGTRTDYLRALAYCVHSLEPALWRHVSAPPRGRRGRLIRRRLEPTGAD